LKIQPSSNLSASGPRRRRRRKPDLRDADLDSRHGATAILLSDLDQMYTSATLSFTEREQIDQARNSVSALVAAEDTILDELHLLLSTPPVELADRE
jgi:hypothetical protein